MPWILLLDSTWTFTSPGAMGAEVCKGWNEWEWAEFDDHIASG
jgi:hypothetical protein